MFYVQTSADEFGNTGHGYFVIEATPDNLGDPYSPGRERLIVTAPEEFRNKWPTLVRDALSWWKETEGPARELSFTEWAELTDFKSKTKYSQSPW